MLRMGYFQGKSRCTYLNGDLNIGRLNFEAELRVGVEREVLDLAFRHREHGNHERWEYVCLDARVAPPNCFVFLTLTGV